MIAAVATSALGMTETRTGEAGMTGRDVGATSAEDGSVTGDTAAGLSAVTRRLAALPGVFMPGRAGPVSPGATPARPALVLDDLPFP